MSQSKTEIPRKWDRGGYLLPSCLGEAAPTYGPSTMLAPFAIGT